MADNSIADWFRSIPKITRWWFSLSVVFPLLAQFGLLDRLWQILLFEPLVYRFQVCLMARGVAKIKRGNNISLLTYFCGMSASLLIECDTEHTC